MIQLLDPLASGVDTCFNPLATRPRTSNSHHAGLENFGNCLNFHSKGHWKQRTFTIHLRGCGHTGLDRLVSLKLFIDFLRCFIVFLRCCIVFLRCFIMFLRCFIVFLRFCIVFLRFIMFFLGCYCCSLGFLLFFLVVFCFFLGFLLSLVNSFIPVHKYLANNTP